VNQAGKGRLTGGGKPAVGIGPDVQGASLGLGEFFGETRQSLGSALSAAQHGAGNDG